MSCRFKVWAEGFAISGANWELGTQPHFFRAVIPQHRNHPIWQEISDFTNGEASLNSLNIDLKTN
ncbi:hypothetical protein QQ045_003577 [Rhodiola kirilowii]